MSEELGLLVAAIEGLKQEQGILKTYMYPLVLAFFSAVLGGLTAWLTIVRQEWKISKNNNREAVSRLNLIAHSAFQTLVSIKKNYEGDLTLDPNQRAARIPIIVGQFKRIDFDLESILFTIPNKDDPTSSRWRNIAIIGFHFENYNLTIDLWEKRSSEMTNIYNSLQENKLDPFTVTPEQLRACVGDADYCKFVDLTQQCVELTDGLIIALSELLNEYNSAIKHLLAKGSKLLNFDLSDNELIERSLAREVDVDFAALGALLGLTEPQSRNAHKTGYEAEPQ